MFILSRSLSILLVFFSFSAFSQLTITTDQADATYSVGESMNFVVNGGFGLASYTIHYDQGVTPAIARGSVMLNGGTTTIPFRGTEPSVVICTVTNNGQTAISGAAFSPFDLQPYEEDPADYDAFWQRQKNELAAVPINPRMTPITTWDNRTRSYRINLGTVDGRRVYGFLSIPLTPGNYPAIITHAAFGVGPNTAIARPEIAADIGAISLSIWMHDAEPDQQAPNAYFPRNWDNPSRNYFRYGVLGIIRAIDYVQTLPEFDGQNIGLNGISEGGGMSIIAAGIDSRVKAVSASIFAHGEHSGFKHGRASGFPYYLNESTIVNPNSSVEHINQGAKYFDALRAAKRFKGAFLGSVGYADLISIPATNFAVFNQFEGSKVLIHKIDWGHQNPEEFYNGKFEFFRKHFGLSGQRGYAADAGNDQFINGANANLSAIIEKNGQVDNSIPGTWKLISGPLAVGFTNQNGRNTVASFSQNGEYILSYVATDNSTLFNKTYFTIADQVKITVQTNSQPTDADQDGVPANQDCNDFNPNISRPGDACNDFNPNTSNDVIQGDCSCAGTAIVFDPCANAGGDADNDGVCANQDCNDFNPNISRPGDACNDFNPNSFNDVIQNDCSCAGTVIVADPCVNAGGDADNDGVCANQDCNDFNPNISRPGDACNDFNSNSTNDVIQSDCSCAGTTLPPTSSTCRVSYTVNGLTLSVEPLNDAIRIVNVYDANYGILLSCEEWDQQCNQSQQFTLPGAGNYFVQIQTYSDWNTPICNIFESISASGIGTGGTTTGTGNDTVTGTTTGSACRPITNGGDIVGSEGICPNEMSTPILSRISPTGGNGTLEYLWLSSTISCPSSLDDAIPGANQSTYAPGQLSETTYFRRLSRRAGCTDWFLGISNCVSKTIQSDCATSTSDTGTSDTGTSDCNAKFRIVNNNRLRFTGIEAAISTVKVIQQDTNEEIFFCNNFGEICRNNFNVRLTPGNYFVQIITGQFFGAPFDCKIFETINIPASALERIDSKDETIGESIQSENEDGQKSIRIAPNPAHDFINVSFESPIKNETTIEIISTVGKIKKQIKLTENNLSQTIQTDDLTPGMYFVRINEKGSESVVKRVLIF